MHELPLVAGPDGRHSFLFLGAHADDIEIGCGATIRKLVTRFPDADYRSVILTSDATRAQEARSAGRSFFAGARNASVDVAEFRESYLPFVGAEVKDYFE